jgi:N-acetylmuramoyl-L-alanine amidase
MMKTILNLIFICFSISISAYSFNGKSFIYPEKDDKRVNIVVIDPGHGGKDFGASVGKAKEKDIVLDVALRLGESIKASYPEIKVIYTRDKDVFIPLYDRAKIANKNKADVFISIHVNGTENSTAQGTETFVLGEHRSKDNFEVEKKENSVILLEDDYTTTYEGYDPNSPESNIMFLAIQSEYLEQSIMLASEVQEQFRLAKRGDRSVKQAGFIVLHQTTMPSVLIELGFISHPNERNYLLSEHGKSTLSASIFNAFKAYKRKIEEKSSFTIRTENGDLNNSKKQSIISKSQSSEENINVQNTKTNKIYYSVQIGASKNKLDPSPSNFKGEKNVFRKESKDIARYFSGKFDNYEDAVKEKSRIEKKFPESFVVAFDNNELISVKKALEKK